MTFSTVGPCITEVWGKVRKDRKRWKIDHIRRYRMSYYQRISKDAIFFELFVRPAELTPKHVTRKKKYVTRKKKKIISQMIKMQSIIKSNILKYSKNIIQHDKVVVSHSKIQHNHHINRIKKKNI